MKIELKEGQLRIDLNYLIRQLSLEETAEVAKHVCADEHLFEAVLNCVVEGSFFDDWWFSKDKVLELRTKLIPLMNEVAQEAVRSALNEAKQAKADAERWRNWAFGMYHHWPEPYWRSRPNVPSWEYVGSISDEEIEDHMRKKGA